MSASAAPRLSMRSRGAYILHALVLKVERRGGMAAEGASAATVAAGVVTNRVALPRKRYARVKAETAAVSVPLLEPWMATGGERARRQHKQKHPSRRPASRAWQRAQGRGRNAPPTRRVQRRAAGLFKPPQRRPAGQRRENVFCPARSMPRVCTAQKPAV